MREHYPCIAKKLYLSSTICFRTCSNNFYLTCIVDYLMNPIFCICIRATTISFQVEGYPIGASAMVPASPPCMDIIVHAPATDVDPAPTPVAVQMQTAFWTSCGECGLGLEYPMIYQHCVLRCPHCHKPFEAIEKSLKSIIGQTDSSVPQAPNDELALKYMEALPCKKNSRRVPRKFQRESGHGVSMRRYLLGSSIMQARHKTKRRRKDLCEPSSSHYEVQSFPLI